jgi:hypothetical protein
MHIMHMCITHDACCRDTRLRPWSPIVLLLDIAQFEISSRDPADLGRGVDSDVGISVGSDFHLRLKIINIGWLETEQATNVIPHEIKHLANVQISRCHLCKS